MSACNCLGCPHAANCRRVCAVCNAIPYTVALPPAAWYDVWPFETLRKKVSDPLNVSVAEKGPAEQFDQPHVVHDSK